MRSDKFHDDVYFFFHVSNIYFSKYIPGTYFFEIYTNIFKIYTRYVVLVHQ